jgi:hypothetical protein
VWTRINWLWVGTIVSSSEPAISIRQGISSKVELLVSIKVSVLRSVVSAKSGVLFGLSVWSSQNLETAVIKLFNPLHGPANLFPLYRSMRSMKVWRRYKPSQTTPHFEDQVLLFAWLLPPPLSGQGKILAVTTLLSALPLKASATQQLFAYVIWGSKVGRKALQSGGIGWNTSDLVAWRPKKPTLRVQMEEKRSFKTGHQKIGRFSQ